MSVDQPQAGEGAVELEPWHLRYPSLSFWVERLAHTKMELPLVDWCRFVDALQRVTNDRDAHSQSREAELGAVGDTLADALNQYHGYLPGPVRAVLREAIAALNTQGVEP